MKNQLHKLGCADKSNDVVQLRSRQNELRRHVKIVSNFNQLGQKTNSLQLSFIHCTPKLQINIQCKKTGLAAPNPSFYIGSQLIEFVDKWPHLGHIISNDCDDMDDMFSYSKLLD